MYLRFYCVTVMVCPLLGILGGAANAQTIARRANLTGGGGPEGKCTIEVVVDGAAEVEIRGDNAILRNVFGGAPQWRRFQCNAPLPPNPVNFRFQGVDGRGSQRLIREPRGGGPAVVRIEDPDNGSEGYTFDLLWQGVGFPPPGGPGPGPGPGRGFGPPRGRTSVDDAVRICQDAVRDRANDRLRGARIEFRRTTIDDNPGRRDWVIGTFEARRGPGRGDIFRFSCSVDFDRGRIRSADFSPADRR